MTVLQVALAASEKAAMLLAFLPGPFEDPRPGERPTPRPLLGWLPYCRDNFPSCFPPA